MKAFPLLALLFGGVHSFFYTHAKLLVSLSILFSLFVPGGGGYRDDYRGGGDRGGGDRGYDRGGYDDRRGRY